MIPTALAEQLARGMREYLLASFAAATPGFHGIVGRLLEREGALFRGPYLSLRLPFRAADQTGEFFPGVPLGFVPHRHQVAAFQRLAGEPPQSTIVATGTGSGKTECFLVPILDHCRAHWQERGVKAILIYPMNALATDQAQRLARMIHTNKMLAGRVSAGLYVGQESDQAHTIMGKDHVIAAKDVLRATPPDILLTNYKMLDFLLIRPEDQPLWRFNDPRTLRFLVVDELHTFDGAQGTDLACLIRRLRDRLRAPEGSLCCVGTSATLGGESQQDRLRNFASEVFSDTFDTASIIGEQRLSVDEYLQETETKFDNRPAVADREALDPMTFASPDHYVRAQLPIWFGPEMPALDLALPAQRVRLGELLRQHGFLPKLLEALGGGARSMRDLLGRLAKTEPQFAQPEYGEPAVSSFLALISTARTWRGGGSANQPPANGHPQPFLQVQIQLWQRELRRMVASVAARPELDFFDDLTDAQRANRLPLVYCRDCGAMGWSGVILQNQQDRINPDLQRLYKLFFDQDPRVAFLFPIADGVYDPRGPVIRVCGHCLRLTHDQDAEQCPGCGGKELVRVVQARNTVRQGQGFKLAHDCPDCGTREGLSLLGARATTLTSTAIDQLFASRYNDDKKLLTFSDSVQDAAHRAGFFSARTWRVNFRTALQQVVAAAGGSLSLADLPAEFERFWRAPARMDDVTFITNFIHPDLMWFRDFEGMKKDGAVAGDGRLIRDVMLRVAWQILAEYTWDSRIGRTLSRAGCSVAWVDPALLDRQLDTLLEILRNEVGGISGLSRGTLGMYARGLLRYLLERGGVLHPLLPASFVESGGDNTFLFGHVLRHLPKVGYLSRLPALLTDQKGAKRFDSLFSGGRASRSWYQDWTDRCLPSDQYALIGDEAGFIYDHVLPALVKAGLLECRGVKGGRIWGLRPEAVRISADVTHLFCSSCKHQLMIPAVFADQWRSSLCLRKGCSGRYGEPAGTPFGYFAQLFHSGDVRRVFAQEHTGLLDRDTREDIEEMFKSPVPQPWFPNLLSCTPTLEMGIDIGDLSSAILCSVPPAQANYLQRIGRAGRRDGNALLLTMANSVPHDLYFYSEPAEMIAGNVDPPGVFLNATAVLERQMTAYCFDRWVATGVPAGALPMKLGDALGQLGTPNPAVFPYNLLTFIDGRPAELAQSFVALFGDRLSTAGRDHLVQFISRGADDGRGLRGRLVDGLRQRLAERDSLRRQVKRLTDLIRQRRKDALVDTALKAEVEELEKEKAALQALVRQINGAYTLNAFTDDGLLPNYAFPEAGVRLKSTIFRKRETGEDDTGEEYETWSYQYDRPAGTGLAELAPHNEFFAGGRRVRIDRVDLNVSGIEDWRFCDNCNYAERIIGPDSRTSCPACHSEMWSDVGRQQQMVRLRQVFARTADRESRISDDQERREPRRYTRQLLVSLEQPAVPRSWCLPESNLPFGIEFFDQATFRDVNFGERAEAGRMLKVAGEASARNGFRLCRHCGQVQTSVDEPRHASICTVKKADDPQHFVECLYLYREFSSEAIRVLLPFTEILGSKRKLHSFDAALYLGLKTYYHGRIDHLRTMTYDEPDLATGLRKSFMMIYDTVPGGTGYLKELLEKPQFFFDVLRAAMDRLKTCGCQYDEQKDGCYRCLFAYRHSYDMPETSRRAAMEVLGDILNHEQELQPTESLNSVSIAGAVTSVLEARFLESLRSVTAAAAGLRLSNERVNGRKGYRLTAPAGAWLIEPQAQLGAQDGSPLNVSVDFLFHPVGDPAAQPVAVFTDGFRFHRDHVGKDMLQRMALARTGRWTVWSLSAEDIESAWTGGSDHYSQILGVRGSRQEKGRRQYMERLGIAPMVEWDGMDSFRLLIRHLVTPGSERWRWTAYAAAEVIACFAGSAVASRRDWLGRLQELVPGDILFELEGLELGGLLADHKAPSWTSGFRLLAAADQEDLLRAEFSRLVLIGWLDDSRLGREHSAFRRTWNGYLRLYNLLQHLPQTYFVSAHDRDVLSFQALFPAAAVAATELPAADQAPEWQEFKEFLADPAQQVLLDRLRAAGCPLCEVPGFELAVGNCVIAEAELAWPGLRLALLREGQSRFAPIFAGLGWRTFSLAEVIAAPESLIRALGR